MNAYADAAAKAHTNGTRVMKGARESSTYVTQRTCMYEKPVVRDGETRWQLHDRRVYQMAKEAMQTWVQEGLRLQGYDITAGVNNEHVWQDVRRSVERGGVAVRRETDEQDEDASEAEDAEGAKARATGERDHKSRYMSNRMLINERVALIHGWRVGHVEGVEGGVQFQRWLEHERATVRWRGKYSYPGKMSYHAERGCVAGCGCIPSVWHVVSMRCIEFTVQEKREYTAALLAAVQAMLRAVPRVSDEERRTQPIGQWCKCRRQLVTLEQHIVKWRETGDLAEEGLETLRQVATGNIYRPKGSDDIPKKDYTQMVRNVTAGVNEVQAQITRAVRRRRRAQRSALAQRYQEGDEWWERAGAARARWARVRQMLRRRTQAREQMRAAFYEYMAVERVRWMRGAVATATAASVAVAENPTIVTAEAATASRRWVACRWAR